MELFIVRHGIAEEKSPGQSDDERRLTAEGRRETRFVARALRRLDCRPQVIFSSPLPRAHETAVILAKLLCPDEAVETSDFLTPMADSAACIRWLHTLKQDSVMLVGHMPNLGGLVCKLLARDALFDIVFKKAGCGCIVFEGPPAASRGRLQWLIQPDQLRALR